MERLAKIISKYEIDSIVPLNKDGLEIRNTHLLISIKLNIY